MNRRTLPLVPSLGTLLLLACGDGAAPAGSGASAYIVPGTPDVSYPIEAAEVTREGSSLRIGYNMPTLLVGVSQRVSLRGPIDGAGRYAAVTGDAGTGMCDLAPGGGLSLRCNETLSGVTVDLTAVEKVAQQVDPQNVSAHLATARRFAGEPIGILEVR